MDYRELVIPSSLIVRQREKSGHWKYQRMASLMKPINSALKQLRQRSERGKLAPATERQGSAGGCICYPSRD